MPLQTFPRPYSYRTGDDLVGMMLHRSEGGTGHWTWLAKIKGGQFRLAARIAA